LPVLRQFELTLDADDVLRAQGADPAAIRARRPVFVEIAEAALAESRGLLQPAVLYRRLGISGLSHERLSLAGGGVLGGPLVSRHLASASEVVVAVCTIGPGLENRAAQVMSSNAQYGLALDGVGSAATEVLAACACQYFESLAGSEGLETTIPLNPGMVGWPTSEGQQQIFCLLPASEIGLTLTSSGMMIPQKSLSLVIGLGSGLDVGGEPCDYCNMRDRCRYRHQ
jgi:hypothetical protein